MEEIQGLSFYMPIYISNETCKIEGQRNNAIARSALMPTKTVERQKHLGRGLESLLGPINEKKADSKPPTTPGQNEHMSSNENTLDQSPGHIPLESISVNPYQARTQWDDAKLEELAASIKANGIIQPIVVRRTSKGFELIAGERRFRASKMLGLDSIPALIRQASDEQMLEWALVENIHRADLNAVERAKAYENYMTTFNLSQTEAAERLGEDRSVVCNYLRLLQLPKELCDMLTDGRLSMGHARAILALPNDDLQRRFAHRALAGRLSVREVERLVRNYLQEERNPTKKRRDKAPHITDLEGKLTQQFGSRVKIETLKDGKRGRLVIEFNSLDEFDGVLERLGVQYADE